MTHSSFGQLLHAFRTAAGLTQEQLAERAGLSPRGISDLERGLRRSPQAATMRLLTEALQLDGDDRAMLARAASGTQDGARRPSRRSRVVGSLPEPSTSFVGRTHEQADILRALETHRLITLTGVAGIGKTRLAVAVARLAGAQHARKPVMVDLGSESDPRLVPNQFAAALAVRLDARHSVVDALLATLRDARLLIVLDNCEHVLGAASALAAALLGGCPGVRILATSRQQLGLGCERVWPVPCLTLSPPEEVSIHRHARYGAVQLFVDRARAVWPSFALSSTNAAAVARVCRRLEGIPLAIELAAARTRVLSVDQIDSRLEDRYRLLSTAPGDAPARHQTLRAAVEWSYELLSKREQLLFERLSVFRGGATLEAVEAVCGMDGLDAVDVSDVLQALVEKSLAVAHLEADQTVRFSQLDTLREFAQARSIERGEGHHLRLSHLAYYMHHAERAVPELRGAHQVAWLNRLEAELGNVRSALAWATATSAPSEDGLRLAAAMAPYYTMRGNVDEGRRWLDALLGRGLPAQPTARVGALTGAGLLAFQSADYERALAVHREALGIVRQLGDRRGIAAQLNQLGAITSERGDRSGAWALFEESLALSRELGDEAGIAAALGNLGITARLQGRLDQARGYLEQAVELSKAIGSSRAMVGSLHSLGNVLRDLSDLEHADTRFREALALAHDMRDWTAVARCIESLAGVMVAQRRNPARAAQLFGAAEVLREETGIPVTSSGQAHHDQVIRTLERSLGAAAMTAAWQHGRSLRRERALKLALAHG